MVTASASDGNPPVIRRLVIPAPSVRDAGGHDLSYTRTLAHAAAEAGLTTLVLLPRGSPLAGDLPGRVLASLPPNTSSPHGLLAAAIALIRRAVGYRAALSGVISPDCLLLLHTATPLEMTALMLALALTPRPAALALVHRWPLPDRSGLRAVMRLALAIARSRTQVVLTSDSDGVAGQIAVALGRPVALLGIPTRCAPPCRSSSQQPLVIGSFGPARKSKGFDRLPPLIAAIRAAAADAGGKGSDVTATIQCYPHRDEPYDGAILAAIDALAGIPGVTLVPAILDDDGFAQAIAACDIVLLPYRQAAYTSATSGLLVAAVLARAVVITTDGTWMARVARTHHLSRVVLMSDAPDVDAIGAAAGAALALSRAPDRPGAAELAWCATHAPAVVLQQLLALAGLRPGAVPSDPIANPAHGG